MIPLNVYIKALLNQSSAAILVDQTHSVEQQAVLDGHIHITICHYTFADGMVLREEREDFHPHEAAPADSASCPPCELHYQVIQQGTEPVHPLSKRFRNDCQRRFWVQTFHLPA